jgi:hypothetical protein
MPMPVKGCDWVRECGRAKVGEPIEVGENIPEDTLEGLVGFDGARVRLGAIPNALGLDEKDD